MSEYFLETCLSQSGGSLKDLEILFLSTPMQADAFEKGNIDLAMVTEPTVTRILQAGHAGIWIPMQQMVPDFQIGLILFGPTIIDKNPEAGKQFMVAYLKAVRQYHLGKTEENLKIMAKHTTLDQGSLKKCCWPAIRGNGQINLKSILDYQLWALRKGYLDQELSPSQFWDSSFIDYANKILSHP